MAYASKSIYNSIKQYFTEKKTVEVETLKINENPVSGVIENHDYVDLGLSVKWATCNVGASSISDYGDYFAWGETEPKEDYSWKTYMWCNGSSETINKYGKSSDYVFVLESLDDAATVNWGEKWRMPTIAELQELVHNCVWEWKIINGVNGYKITAKNNNWIFLPAAGFRSGTSSNGVGSFGAYWSSTVNEINSNYAYGLYFGSNSRRDNNSRYSGLTVRPVVDIR